MAIEFTVDHDHTYAGEEGVEQLIGWITFSVSTFPGDFRVREQGGGVARTMNIPSRRGWLATDGHLYKDQTLEQPCRLVANDPAFNLRHLTYLADFELTTVLGDPVAVPPTYFPAPSTDTTLQLTKVMADPSQPVMEVRAKVYVEDILDMDKDHIADIIDMTDTGYQLVSATDASAARQVIGSASQTRSALRSPLLAQKLFGGNITVKPGYAWLHLWSEWDWDNWIKPQVDRAIALGMNTVRLIGEAATGIKDPNFTSWIHNASFSGIDGVVQTSTGLYRLVTAGTSNASPSSPPTGTGTGIVDGTCVWDYAGPLIEKPTRQEYIERWQQLAQYCTDNGLALYPCLVTRIIQAYGYEYTDADITDAVCDTAEALADYPCVIGYDIFQEGDYLAGFPWKQSQPYSTGAKVVSGSGLQYVATTGGTSSGSGTGPSGTGTGITDGTVVWDYERVPLLVSDVTAMLAAVRDRIGRRVPLTTSFSPTPSGSLWTEDADNMYAKIYTDANGPDFIDLHLYYAVTPRDIDYLVWRTGKPVLVGEFGATKSLADDEELLRFSRVKAIHQKTGVLGSLVWALADQGVNNQANLSGVFDNTGWSLSTPLSVTSGERTEWTAILAQFAISDYVPRHQRPELLAPLMADPLRGVVTPVSPYGTITSWRPSTNTTTTSDARGAAFKCTSGGATTSAFIWARDTVTTVTPGVAYEYAVSVMADATGRVCEAWIEWYTDAFVYVSQSSVISGTDATVMPLNLRVVAVAPATAAYPQLWVRWSSAQATNEVHILRSASFREA